MKLLRFNEGVDTEELRRLDVKEDVQDVDNIINIIKDEGNVVINTYIMYRSEKTLPGLVQYVIPVFEKNYTKIYKIAITFPDNKMNPKDFIAIGNIMSRLSRYDLKTNLWSYSKREDEDAYYEDAEDEVDETVLTIFVALKDYTVGVSSKTLQEIAQKMKQLGILNDGKLDTRGKHITEEQTEELIKCLKKYKHSLRENRNYRTYILEIINEETGDKSNINFGFSSSSDKQGIYFNFNGYYHLEYMNAQI